jgi:hypothetical protein
MNERVETTMTGALAVNEAVTRWAVNAEDRV